MLHEFKEPSLEVGLRMNLKSTKVMYNEFAEDIDERTTIDSNEIKQVDDIISYLSQCISNDSASKE